MKDEDKEVIAYHEAGHALMAGLLPGADPIEKVSIIPGSGKQGDQNIGRPPGNTGLAGTRTHRA